MNSNEKPTSDRLLCLETIPVDELGGLYDGIAAESIGEGIDLRAFLSPDCFQVLPTGSIYLPASEVRRILLEALGAGVWALRQIAVYTVGGRLLYDGALVVRGRFIARAVGGSDYDPEGKKGFDTALESARSQCLTRCAKDIGLEAPDKEAAEAWIAEYAVEVWCFNQKGGASDRPFWRRKSSGPIDAYPWKERDGKPAANGSSKPPANGSSGSYAISIHQAGRFRRIAKELGYTSEELDRFIQESGLESLDKMPRKDYDALEVDLRRPAVLQRVRDLLSEEAE